MKSKEIDHVTSNEQFVRQRIFDGDLPIDAAGAELLRIERAQNATLRRRISNLERMIGRDTGISAKAVGVETSIEES